MGLDNPLHILLFLVLALLVFGAKRLPEMGRSLGEGMRGFKDSLSSPAASVQLDEISAAAAAPATSFEPAAAHGQVAERAAVAAETRSQPQR